MGKGECPTYYRGRAIGSKLLFTARAEQVAHQRPISMRLGWPRTGPPSFNKQEATVPTILLDVKDFQILIAGILGFCGVIVALLHNGKQMRTQRRKERFYERQMLRVALIEELNINRSSLVSNINDLKDNFPSTIEFWVATYEMNDVFKSFVGRIGVLTKCEVSKVLSVYLLLRTYRASLFLHSRLSERVKIDNQHVPVPGNRRRELIKMQQSLVRPLAQAIEALEMAHKAGH